jgi:hypothetical protein
MAADTTVIQLTTSHQHRARSGHCRVTQLQMEDRIQQLHDASTYTHTALQDQRATKTKSLY